MSTHDISIRKDKQPFLGSAFVASCSCGRWKSRRETYRSDAVSSGESHIIDAKRQELVADENRKMTKGVGL